MTCSDNVFMASEKKDIMTFFLELKHENFFVSQLKAKFCVGSIWYCNKI